MNAFLHALNIGTLATWLSMAGFGTTALVVPHFRATPVTPPEREETRLIPDTFTLGDSGTTDPESIAPTPATEPDPLPGSPPAPFPAPPELPPIPDFDPLPEIPEFAAPGARPKPAPPRRQPQSPPPSSGNRRETAPPPGGKPDGSNQARSPRESAILSDAARLARGRMPQPAYPPQARRAGHTGTVLVEFTVDTNGRVISAVAKSSSGWPALDAEAVRAVRRWTFPPGGVMKLQRPIDFQLR